MPCFNLKIMNVKNLKEAIANLPDEMEVILQKDSEGNGYSPLSGADADAVACEGVVVGGVTPNILELERGKNRIGDA